MAVVKCALCPRTFERGATRRMYCGEDCSIRGLELKMEARKKARAEKAKLEEPRQCAAEGCPRTFTRKGIADARRIYCGEECRARGLLAAVLRQTERREQAKAEARKAERPTLSPTAGGRVGLCDAPEAHGAV